MTWWSNLWAMLWGHRRRPSPEAEKHAERTEAVTNRAGQLRDLLYQDVGHAQYVAEGAYIGRDRRRRNVGHKPERRNG